jgi:hypothetical protein
MSNQVLAEVLQPPSPVESVARSKLSELTKLTLIARSGGRCQFCNAYLFEHPLTKGAGNFSENAHIVAFRERGPRGRGNRPADVDDIENLMLLCKQDHRLIDTNPEEYSREILERCKREHEARIMRVTGIGPAMQTTLVQLKVKIGTQIVEVDRAEAFNAIHPRYPGGERHIIDLTQLGDEEPGAFYALAANLIRRRVAQIYETGREIENTKHLSVLALAPIPLLITLGNALSNKVATEFYQCHRTRQENRWTWYEGEAPARFEVRRLRAGTDPLMAGLVLSLSGSFDARTLPPHIDDRCSLYELVPVDAVPNTGLIRQRQDLEAFRVAYRVFLAGLQRDHAGLRELHLFPALPASAAVACGFDLLPKVHPALVIYDNVAKEGGFVERLRVNEHERQWLSDGAVGLSKAG